VRLHKKTRMKKLTLLAEKMNLAENSKKNANKV
jgi:hypothetical protein